MQAFSYDATGNRLSKTTGASTATYAYATNTHRLTSDGVASRTLDAAGHGTAIGAKTFVYDDYGRMIEYRNSGTLTRAYTYNGHGERVARWNVLNAANDMIFVYDEAGHLIGEYRKDGTRVREIVWMDDTPVAIFHGPVASPTLYYILTDHLNTPRAIVNPPNNGIIWRWDITGSVFGEHAVNEDPDNNGSTYLFNLRYPGQYYDSDTGLHYNYFRDYDPATGRYLQSDPVGMTGGTNTFSYVSGQPLRRLDPLGLIDIYVGGAGDFDTAIVAGYQYRSGGNNSVYFQWHQEADIRDFISRLSKDEPINLIGHSMGGATVARIAMSSKRVINLLITIDPVGDVSQAEFCAIRSNTLTWLNVSAEHEKGMDRSDFVGSILGMLIGGKWGNRPAVAGADIHITSPANHGDFRGMMEMRGPDGFSAAEFLRYFGGD